MTDDAAISEALAPMRVALERTRAVGRQLVGLDLHDANELATRSGCRLRVVERDGKGLVVTADFVTNRINIAIDGGVIVATYEA